MFSVGFLAFVFISRNPPTLELRTLPSLESFIVSVDTSLNPFHTLRKDEHTRRSIFQKLCRYLLQVVVLLVVLQGL